jgi:plastocyanin
MFHRVMRKSVTTLFAVLIALPLSAATIDVQVAAPNGAAVTDAVVYAIPDGPLPPIGRKVATMDQKDRTFIPHVLPIQTGTWVEFPNSDDIRHQVYSLSPAKKFQLPLYKGKLAFPIQFGKPGAVLLGCNIHDQMSAWIIVVDTPYFAKSENGRASVAGVPAGSYTLHVWSPEMAPAPKPQRVTVAADDKTSVSFVVNK